MKRFRCKYFIFTLVGVVLFAGVKTDKVYASSVPIVSVDVLHNHSGSSSTGGGCYTSPVNTNYGKSEVKTQCTGRVTSWVEADGINHPITSCGHNCSSGLCHGVYGSAPPTGEQCRYKIPTGRYNCNHCGSSSCSGVHVSSYTLGCNKTTDTVVGSVSLHKSVSNKYYLSVSVSGVSVSSYTWSTGSADSSIEVTSNGIYSCDVVVTEGSASTTVNVVYEVTDYDTEPPQISQVYCSTQRVKGFVDITVSASDNVSIDLEYMLSN